MSAAIPENTLEKFTTFGDLLRFLRRRAGITQLELSIAVGYSDAQISRLEQNLRPPDIPTIEARFVSGLGLEDEPKAVARLLDLAANVRREDAPGLGLCPYKGLSYFDEADADLFVGREELISRLIERVFSISWSSTPHQTRFLAVVGASGSGKSSLIRAGIIPALRWNKKSSDWQIYVFTPTAHPLESLALSLTHENSPVSTVATLMDDLARDTRSLQIFTKRSLHAKNGSRVLLVIDQFEELFTLCRLEQEKAAFVASLLTAASEADGPVIVLIALRADFYAHCANYVQLREALAANQEYIGAMTDEELRRAIEEPAHRCRWEFEPGMIDLLLHDVGHEPGALPLLSHSLLETWQRRRGRVMTLSGYTSSGSVRGAIAESAEAVFTDQFTHEQQDIARRIFLRLTELGDETGAGDTRRRASINELTLKPEETNSTHSLLNVLADARLIVTSEDMVEGAHEALIREWPRLRGWLEDNREGLRLHRHVTESAQQWQAFNCDPELLYRGAQLTRAQEWGSTQQEEMNELEREFLDASISLAQRESAEREAQQRRELEAAQKLAESEKQRAEEQTKYAKQLSRRALYLTGAFIIALLMAFTALYFGSQARKTAVTAQNDRRIATSRELAAASLNNLREDPERSILLALTSISTTRSLDGTILPESLEALHQAIVASPIRMTLRDHETGVLSAVFNPDGKQLATIGEDGSVILWDSTSGKAQFRLPGSTKPTNLVTSWRIAYNPDGTLLAACESNQVKVYDPTSGDLILTLSGHKSDVTAITFSRDGAHIASGDAGGTVIIWGAKSGKPQLELLGHSNAIEGLTFSPDGKWLITSSDDTTIKVWDAMTGSLLHDYHEFTGVTDTVTFSPDGRFFAFSDGSIHVSRLDPSDSKQSSTLTTNEILNIPNAIEATFSPDGKQLAGTNGQQIKVWDSTNGKELLTLVGHTSWVIGIAFSPDGKRLASTSLDGTVKIWSLTPGQETVTVANPLAGYGTRVVYNPIASEFAVNGGDGSVTLWDAKIGEAHQTLKGHDQEVLNIAFSPDGMRLASGSLDGTMIVWNVKNGKKLFSLAAHENSVRDIAFSPDGSMIATGGFDGKTKIWNATDGKFIREITGHQGLVLGVAFSPDGKNLATTSTDLTTKIWEIQTGKLLFTLMSGGPDVAYNPDGAMLAVGTGDGTVTLWDTKTGSMLRTLSGHNSAIQSLAFSSDGNWLATGSEDNTAKIWDLQTGAEILSLPGSLGGVKGVAFSPTDGNKNLAVASTDGIVRIFLLQVDDLLTLAQSRVTRSLTAQECKKYLHVSTCPDIP